MTDPEWDITIEGWEHIAERTGRSRTWVIERSAPHLEDPLPVSYPGRESGMARATPVVTWRKLYRWLVRQGMRDAKPGMMADLPCQGCGTFTEHRATMAYGCTGCGMLRAA